MLTSQQQNKIVQLLGYGGKSIQAGSVIYNKIMNDRLHQLPPDTETLTLQFLSNIESIECQMNKAVGRLSTQKIDDITLNNRELEDLRRERKRWVREISALLDIPYISTNGVNVGVCS